MAYAGARGETAQQMVDALYFMLPYERLYPVFNALDLKLAKLGDEPDQQGSDEDKAETGFELNI